ncbi:MAG TPA: MarR family transcriptional regulator [Spirochaetia bacterium]|nr:MarR family transcriptional regulator [Spirochaetia bacterium]
MKAGRTEHADEAQLKEVVELLRDVLHGLLMTSVPAWLDLQLTLPQLRAVFVVAHHEGCSLREVAGHLGVGEPTASHLIDRLVTQGLIERGDDPEDRRRAVLRLSAGGRKLITRLLGWENILATWLREIPRADLASLSRGLSAVRDNVRRKLP